MWGKIFKNIFQTKPAIDVTGAMAEPAWEAEVEKAGLRLAGIFNRSVRIRQVDAGSCNACEWECTALANPVYDVQRFGIDFVASPRHADIVLVTGPISNSMALALKQTFLATPEPRIVVGCGNCTKDGGVYRGSYGVTDGLSGIVPVAGYIPGCPPTPLQLIRGLTSILAALTSPEP